MEPAGYARTLRAAAALVVATVWIKDNQQSRGAVAPDAMELFPSRPGSAVEVGGSVLLAVGLLPGCAVREDC